MEFWNVEILEKWKDACLGAFNRQVIPSLKFQLAENIGVLLSQSIHPTINLFFLTKTD